jgi:hypothetical protein
LAGVDDVGLDEVVVVALVVEALVVVARFSTAGEAMTEAAVARSKIEKMFFMIANTSILRRDDSEWTGEM